MKNRLPIKWNLFPFFCFCFFIIKEIYILKWQICIHYFGTNYYCFHIESIARNLFKIKLPNKPIYRSNDIYSFFLSLKFSITINRFLTIQTHIEYEIIVCENRFSQEICFFSSLLILFVIPKIQFPS